MRLARKGWRTALLGALALGLLLTGCGSASSSGITASAGRTNSPSPVLRCTSSAHPATSGRPARAFDVATGRLIVFGGLDAQNNPSADTWAWSTGCWTKVNASSSPSPRDDMVAIYSSADRVVIGYGGAVGGAGQPAAVVFDTWVWNGSNWSLRATSGPQLIAPSIVDDPKTGHVLLIGTDARTDNVEEVWSWSGASWGKLNPPSSPPARLLASIAPDPATGTVILFGGRQTNGSLGDTWVWDGTTWTRSLASGPSARFSAALAYDPVTKRVILAGGQGSTGLILETWAWDGSTWIQLHPKHPASSDAAVASPDHIYLVDCFGNVTSWDGQDWATQ